MDKRVNNGGHSTAGRAGRPSMKDELKAVELASPHVADAFLFIATVIGNEKESTRDRIAAAKVIIEYACGKPSQTVDSNTTLTIDNFNLKDVLNFDNTKQ